MDTTDSQLHYTTSIHYDRRLYQEDIAGSIAHARMLGNQGIITKEEAKIIIEGLGSIADEIETGKFPWREELEDLHMNIEARLYDKVGAVAGKLHTARSRNDQVVTDLRLYTKKAILKNLSTIRDLQSTVLDIAEANINVLLPGYTHMQPAQPVLLSHHFLAYFEMLQRDSERLVQALKQCDTMPLGSGALAGVPYPIDREITAKELGFSAISRNSMDAVSDRDFVVEYQASAAICMMHLSRLAEELVLWSSNAFSFIRLSQEYTTGSSIMPQKQNPDFAELARGKTGRVYGNLFAMLTTLKGLPLTYNRDLQEDKEGLFDTIDTLTSTVQIFTGMLKGLEVNKEKMLEATNSGSLLATDIADYLVSKGLPFREAHGIIAKLVAYTTDKNQEIHQLKLEDYKQFSSIFESDVLDITIERSVSARDVAGGTALNQVKTALQNARELIRTQNVQ